MVGPLLGHVCGAEWKRRFQNDARVIVDAGWGVGMEVEPGSVWNCRPMYADEDRSGGLRAIYRTLGLRAQYACRANAR